MSHGRSHARNLKYDATGPLPPAVEEACTRAAEGFGGAHFATAAGAPSATAAFPSCDPPAEPGADKKGMAEELPIWVPPGHLTLLLGESGRGQIAGGGGFGGPAFSRMKVPRSSVLFCRWRIRGRRAQDAALARRRGLSETYLLRRRPSSRVATFHWCPNARGRRPLALLTPIPPPSPTG